MKIVAFDSENNNKQVAWICFYDGKNFYDFKSQKKAIAFLDSFKTETYFFATNLSYDLLNIWSRDDFIREVSCFYGKSRLITATYGKCKFMDTLNSWPMSVSLMGHVVGLPKLDMEYDNERLFSEAGRNYCRRDTEITYLFTVSMLEKYDKLGIPFKSTIASTALNYFIKAFDGGGIKYRKIKTKTLDRLRPHYMGGRCEAFFIGNINRGSADAPGIHCIDYNSLYPSVMKDNKFPNPYYYYKVKSIKKVPKNAFYLATVVVKSDMQYPCIPRRYDNKLCFPNGTFVTYANSVELEYFKTMGGDILKYIGDILVYPYPCYPFSEYVDKIYNARLSTQEPFEKQIYKLLLNTLYGKFGTGKENSSILKYTEYDKLKRKGESFTDPLLILNKEYVLTTKISKNYPFYTNYAWPIFCTAYARVKLHKLILQVRDSGRIPLYCDTDSVIFSGDQLESSYNLGEYKTEWSTHYIELVNLKQYAYWNSDRLFYKCKGVPIPQRESFFNGEEVIINRPVKLKESLRAIDKENQTPNVWVDKTKQTRNPYSKGTVDKETGKVSPLILKEYC